MNAISLRSFIRRWRADPRPRIRRCCGIWVCHRPRDGWVQISPVTGAVIGMGRYGVGHTPAQAYANWEVNAS